MQKKTKKQPNWIRILQRVLIYLLCVAIFAGLCYLKGFQMAERLSYTVLLGIGMSIVFVLAALFEEKNMLDYDNGKHIGRFNIIWLISFLFACGFSFLPTAGWPYLSLFVLLALYSNVVLGLVSGIVLMAVSVLLSGAPFTIFALYLFAGLVGISMFSKLDENYKIGLPLSVSGMMLLVALTAGIVLFENSKLKLELFIIPFMNVVISIILLIIILKIFSSTVIFKYRERYLEITDPEYLLLVQLKEKSKDEYYKALHTAYFCDRISRKLNLDADACKSAGYYHILGSLTENQTWEEMNELCSQHSFPEPVVRIMEEYLHQGVCIKSKETAVLLMSEAVISAILHLLHETPNTKPDYNHVIETVFKAKLQTSKLNFCELTLEELHMMKSIFKEEKLYYDFLH